MRDLLNRQDAIEAIRNIKAITGTFDDEILMIDKAQAQTELMMLPSVQSDQLDETRLSQGIWTKVCKITDSEGLQHEVIHYGDLKAVIEEVTGWMI